MARWGPDENPYPDFGNTFEDLYKGTADLFLWPTLYLWEFPKPTISAIHGYCMGGGIYLGLLTDRWSRPDDPGREHRALAGIGDMHGAALAAAGADGAAHHLAVDLLERHALADQVVQPAVGRHQLVVGAQRHPHGGGDGLLAARRPVDTHELPGADALGQPIVGRLHQHHQRIQAALRIAGVAVIHLARQSLSPRFSTRPTTV